MHEMSSPIHVPHEQQLQGPLPVVSRRLLVSHMPLLCAFKPAAKLIVPSTSTCMQPLSRRVAWAELITAAWLVKAAWQPHLHIAQRQPLVRLAKGQPLIRSILPPREATG